MAAAVPLVIAFAEAGSIAGMASMATASVAGFLQVGGAVLGAVGALTGKKDVAKFGALMSLGGGIANAASAASSAGAEASSAWDAAGSAAGSDAAQFAKYGASQAADTAGQAAATGAASSGTELAASALDGYGADLGLFNDGSMYAQAERSVRQAADATQAAGQTGAGGTPIVQSAVQGGAKPAGLGGIGPSAPTDLLSSEGSRLSIGDVMQSVGNGVKATPQWVKENPDLAKFGFSILESIYGPQAEQIDMQRSMLDRRRANMNSPIRLTNAALQGG